VTAKLAKSTNLKVGISFLLFILTPGEAFGFAMQNEWTPGKLALRYRKSPQYWSESNAAFIDGSVTNTTSANQRLDRRLTVGHVSGADVVAQPRFGLRLNVLFSATKRRQLETVEPEATIDETYYRIYPSIDGTYITPAGLELFAGAAYFIQPGHTQEYSSQTVSSKAKWKSVSFLVPRVGIVRRGTSFAGGFYYLAGRSASREVTKVADDGSEVTSQDVVQDPTTMAVCAEFTSGSVIFDTELAAISASEGGNRSESGFALSDDHLRIVFGTSWALGAGRMRMALAHQTLAYSKSAYADIDSISFTSFRTQYKFGDEITYTFLGLTYGRGRDTQSTPEFNAKYSVDAYAVSLGGAYAF
jgi:hypothetical protein